MSDLRNPNPKYQSLSRRGNTWINDKDIVRNPANEIDYVRMEASGVVHADSIPVNEVKEWFTRQTLSAPLVGNVCVVPSYPKETHREILGRKTVEIVNAQTGETENLLGPAETGPDGVAYFLSGEKVTKKQWLEDERVQAALREAGANPPDMSQADQPQEKGTHVVRWHFKHTGASGTTGPMPEAKARELAEEFSNSGRSDFEYTAIPHTPAPAINFIGERISGLMETRGLDKESFLTPFPKREVHPWSSTRQPEKEVRLDSHLVRVDVSAVRQRILDRKGVVNDGAPQNDEDTSQEYRGPK